MATDSLNFTKSPLILNGILSALNRGSAFQRAAMQVPLDGNGTIQRSIGSGDASWVAEGARKPVNNAEFSELELTGKKLVRTVTLTEEAANDVKELERAILTEATGSISATYDKTVAGLVTAPTGFDSLAGTAPVTVTNYSSFMAALAPVADGVDNQIVLNNALLYELRSVVNANDVPVFQIDAERINGVRYFLMNGGSTPLGFVGPFATRAIWGVIPGSVAVRRSTEATVYEGNTQVDLFSENKIAYLVEARVGFRVYDLNDFKTVVSSKSGS